MQCKVRDNPGPSTLAFAWGMIERSSADAREIMLDFEITLRSPSSPSHIPFVTFECPAVRLYLLHLGGRSRSGALIGSLLTLPGKVQIRF